MNLVVFDLDGTLVDSRRDLADSANAMLRSYGAEPLSEDAVGRMVGDGAPVLVARVFAAAGVPQPADALGRFLSIYDDRLLTHTRPYEGITDLLVNLAPRVALGVLTNKPRRATVAILEGLDLTRFFPDAQILGGDGPFPRKPDPSGLRHLMSVFGASPQSTLLVGDSLIDLRTSRAADARACLARYGFGWDSAADHDNDARDAWLIDEPRELLRYV